MFSTCLLHFHVFSVTGGVLVVPGGSFGRPWKCLGSFRGFLVGPWDILKGAWWLLVGSLGVLGGACGIPRSSWSGSRGVLGAAWGSLETPWGSLVALGVSLGDSVGVPVGFLGSPCRDLVPHMLRTPMFQRVLFFVALASLFRLFVALAKLKVTQRNSVNPAEARAHQTLCTAMF